MLQIDAAHCRDTALGVGELCSGTARSSAAICPFEGPLRSTPRPGHSAKVLRAQAVWNLLGSSVPTQGWIRHFPPPAPGTWGSLQGGVHPRKKSSAGFVGGLWGFLAQRGL